MTVILTLGDILFQGFEVPDNIRIGGEQALVVHKLPGGARTIDAMGADDADIPWTGRFRGRDAESRARLLERYRKTGEVVSLRWSTYRYKVIVQSFRADYQQPFEIPYSVNCAVVTDESAPILTGIPGLDELIGSDLGYALGISDSIGVTAIGTAISAVRQAVGSVNTLRNAPSATLVEIAGMVAGAGQVVASAFAAQSAVISSAPAITAGGSPQAMSASLNNQTSAFGQISQLTQLGAALTRMGKNLLA